MLFRNCWYMIAWSSEIGRAPRRRLIMNEPVALYRCEAGKAVALEDRCPHRNYPLSRGTLVGDNVQCGYHGLIVGTDGTCVHAPGQDRAPSTIQVKAYPLHEADGIVWIWMGIAKPDPALLPDLSWLHEDGWTPWIDGYIHLKCQHQLLTENLLDISHLAHVHKSTMGSDPEIIARAETSVTATDRAVRLLYANATQGFKSGSYSVISANISAQFTPVSQERVRAYEAGFKQSLLEHKIEVTGAAFFYDYKDKQLVGTTQTLFGQPGTDQHSQVLR